MKFLILIHGDESQMRNLPVDQTGMSPEYHAYNEAMAKAGVMLGGERLRPTDEAVSIRGGEVLDGPYAETKEQFGGYYLIDVPSKAEAVEWGRKCPAAQFGTIEVREIWPTRPQ
jgi:hypothetical protein